MTIDREKFRTRLRELADAAAAEAKRCREAGDNIEASFQSGRQAGMITALAHLTLAENEAYRERDGYGEGIDLDAVARLEASFR